MNKNTLVESGLGYFTVNNYNQQIAIYLLSYNFSKGSTAGPLRTSPVCEKRESWHAQSYERSPSFHLNPQPICVQVVLIK